MATVNQSLINVEMGSQVSRITSMTDVSEVLDTDITLASNQRIFQIIITNNTANTNYVKIWDLAFGSAPAQAGGTAFWDTQPLFVLPVEGNSTADYTFMGEDQYEFSNGVLVNVGLGGGNAYSTGATSVDLTVFVKA
tara:strand:- start:1959 stop:2369 length:411 start_codon:yes stop_codon:yes gene_type:complete